MSKHFIGAHETRLQRSRYSSITPGALPQAGVDEAPLALREAGAGALCHAGIDETPIALTASFDSRLGSLRSAKGAFAPVARSKIAFGIDQTSMGLAASLDSRLVSVRSAKGAFSQIAWGNAPGNLHRRNTKAPKARFIRAVRGDGR